MSSGSNQRTLFQTWGGPVSQNKAFPPKKEVKKAAGRRRANVAPSNGAQVANVTTRLPSLPPNPLWPQIGHGARTEDPPPLYEYDDDDDDLMVVAVSEAEKCLQLNDANYFRNDARVSTESAALGPSASPGRTYPDLPGFDGSSAKVWIYPTNYPIREYQVKISEAALFRNTLVCLPTGLGKTFIAAVVMYNFYRWYPSGKIVFMAPTKPLVAQQIEACYKVMGIPQAHMAELTGTTAANRREDVWRTKRVFFLTPQVMANDLSRDTCPAQQVKCVVIDEAHKALGNHAYCQVIRQLCSQTLQFRILALSATPGGDTKSVQSVISNLLVSHIELRSEESPDIQAHSHERSVDKMVVPLGESLSAHQARYLQQRSEWKDSDAMFPGCRVPAASRDKHVLSVDSCVYLSPLNEQPHADCSWKCFFICFYLETPPPGVLSPRPASSAAAGPPPCFSRLRRGCCRSPTSGPRRKTPGPPG
uniref:Helicase ATP-binding domain-containing protein n=1 Tax=Gasterosteus aculeatus aculeatus TaxID=481459 RepID=A0AAQ4NNH4_GASAC